MLRRQIFNYLHGLNLSSGALAEPGIYTVSRFSPVHIVPLWIGDMRKTPLCESKPCNQGFFTCCN